MMRTHVIKISRESTDFQAGKKKKKKKKNGLREQEMVSGLVSFGW